MFEGRTTGTSIAILIRNQDQRSRDYEKSRIVYRPGMQISRMIANMARATFAAGGDASARETVARVAAGAIAKKLMLETFGGQVVGYTKQVGPLPRKSTILPRSRSSRSRSCPTERPTSFGAPTREWHRKWSSSSNRRGERSDSIGGVAEMVARGVPAGLGEPVFDKLKADLGQSAVEPARVLGVEYGIGFRCATMRGSENNDLFFSNNGPSGIETQTNRHGGMLGGISSGMPIILRAAVKPTSSLPRPQLTVTRSGESTEIRTTRAP